MDKRLILLLAVTLLTMTGCIIIEDEYSSNQIDDDFLFQEDQHIHSLKFAGPQSIIYSTNDQITEFNIETGMKQVIFDPPFDIFYVVITEDPDIFMAMVLEWNPNNTIRTKETFYKVELGKNPENLDIQLWYEESKRNAVLWGDNIAYNYGNGYDIYTNDLYLRIDHSDSVFIDQGYPIAVSPPGDELLYSKLDTTDYSEELAIVNLTDYSISIISDTKKVGYAYTGENFAWTERGIIEMYRTSSNVTITDHEKGEQLFSVNVNSEPFWPFVSPECGWIGYQFQESGSSYFQNQSVLRLMNPFLDIPEYDALTINSFIELMSFSPNCDQMVYKHQNKVYLMDLK